MDGKIKGYKKIACLQQLNPTTMNTRDEFRNGPVLSVTEADAARKADLNWKL